MAVTDFLPTICESSSAMVETWVTYKSGDTVPNTAYLGYAESVSGIAFDSADLPRSLEGMVVECSFSQAGSYTKWILRIISYEDYQAVELEDENSSWIDIDDLVYDSDYNLLPHIKLDFTQPRFTSIETVPANGFYLTPTYSDPTTSPWPDKKFRFDMKLYQTKEVEVPCGGCGYSISRLEDVVYLLPQDAVKDIVIDNGEAYISGITATPLTLKAYNVQVTETEELNERYAFTQNLQFTVDGYMNKGDLDGRYCAMVKSKDGGVWMMNPEFNAKVTYTYTLDASGSKTDFTLATISNIPMLRVIDFVGASTTSTCGYDLLSIKNLRLNENNYSHVNDNHIIFTNDGFKYVDFMKDSCKFTETFDGNNVSHKLTFNIPFSTYKSSWHYNLLEFTENKYAAVIDMSNGKHLLCGFGFGLQPSYTVTVNDGDSVDHIEITLQDLHDNGNLIEFKDSLIFDGDGNTTWRYISGYSGYISYECVGLYQAKYLLQEEIDILRNPTGRYKCLSGYQYRFQDLNIIGTFSETVLFECMECTDFCGFSTTLPSTIYFYSAGTQTFTLNSQSDWSISSMTSFISVTPISGSGGTYTLTVTNTATPTDIAQMGQLVITYCGGTKQKTVNVVVMKPQGCFPLGKVYHIDCEAQTYEIATTCCIARVEDLSGVTTDIKWQPERWIRLTFPLNNDDMDVEHNYSGSSRTTLIKVTYCDGEFDWITITQDKMYSTWVDECWNCNGSQMCRRWQLYSGRSEDYTTEACGIYKYTDCTYSTTCGGACEMWSGYTMVQHPYYCMGGDVYRVERKLVAKNGSCNSGVIVPLWEETLETRLGSKLPAPWTCPSGITYDYRWELTTYGICVGTTKYQSYRLERSSDSGSTWEDVVPSQLSADGDGSETPVIIEEECVECGYVPSCTQPTPTSDYLTFVAQESGNFAFYPSNSNVIEYSRDNGSTWTVGTAVTVNAGDKVLWRGTMTPYDDGGYGNSGGIGQFTSNARFSASGNVMSLLFGDNFEGETSLSEYNQAFANLFEYCDSLMSIDGLELPATTLSDSCYARMFIGCGITSIPSGLLPATELAYNCYFRMFMECGITSVPSGLLPATTLADRCYTRMFSDCYSLETAPNDLLPSTTLTTSCYDFMFYNCTSLVEAPILLAPTLVEKCYFYMFYGCTNLDYIECYATDISATDCTQNWLASVAANGTFETPSTTEWLDGASGIPYGWQRQDA